MNVAIDNIIVTTENCSLRPYFAEPGTHALLLCLVFDHFLSCRDQRRTKLKCSLIEFNYVNYDFKLYVVWSDAMKTNIKIYSTDKVDTDLLADATLESLKTNRSTKWIISERMLQKIYKFRLFVGFFSFQ